jgi:hypothetical protein
VEPLGNRASIRDEAKDRYLARSKCAGCSRNRIAFNEARKDLGAFDCGQLIHVLHYPCLASIVQAFNPEYEVFS